MINTAALQLIKEFEELRTVAYLDTLAKPPVWTIGYGTTAAAGVGIVPRLGMTITEAQATGYLDAAVTKFAHHVTAALMCVPTDNQFGAMVSLAYNIGPGAFAKSSICRKFNAGDIQGAADAFLLWNKAGGKVLTGLVRRRYAERALFLSSATSLQKAQTPPAKPTDLQTPKATPEACAPKRGWLAIIIAAIVAFFRSKK